ncbi:Glycoside hydrolase [Cinnamomum micranthum f. kanehirae]|uniref:Glycoside hydrolase n=1 Tax=Cinnamomum micranthum f. kanehirae TaxID=337451 RepID=A0A3S3MMG2_9MAGN|nr:Glycoside hydrolase [Cinnamomum micranthum f. kanehirae]
MTRILIPKGIFLVGALVFEGPCKSTVIFNVKGAVKPPTDLNKFKDDVWIHFKHINGLLITGGGTFDGQGASAWPHNHCDNNLNCKLLPTSIKQSFVNGAKVSSISSINSKFLHMNIYKSKNMKMKSLKIFAPENSPNTDGIHIGDSSTLETRATLTYLPFKNRHRRRLHLRWAGQLQCDYHQH